MTAPRMTRRGQSRNAEAKLADDADSAAAAAAPGGIMAIAATRIGVSSSRPFQRRCQLIARWIMSEELSMLLQLH